MKRIGWDVKKLGPLRGTVCVDAVATAVKGFYTVDQNGKRDYHNCIQLKTGPRAGEWVPISHLFLYCFVPHHSGLKKFPLWFEPHFDGHARQDQIDNVLKIKLALEPIGIIIDANPTDGDAGY